MAFSSHLFANGEIMSRTSNVLEILTWKSKPGVSDKEMIQAVDSMVIDLKKLKGFLNQTLYKEEDGTWIDIYYWHTEKDAHASNESMADKDSLQKLMSIIEPNTVTMKVVSPKQSSGGIEFK
jgi:hypothetical protein